MDAVLFDVDGTLCNVSELRPWVTGKRKDFDTFHRLSLKAPPIPWVVTAARDHWNRGRDILVVTARSEKFRGGTLDWLGEHDIPCNQLFMRPTGDYRPDYEVKKEILGLIRDKGYNVIRCYDDNPSVVRLWIEEGIPCTVVPGWED